MGFLDTPISKVLKKKRYSNRLGLCYGTKLMELTITEVLTLLDNFYQIQHGDFRYGV